MRAVNLTKGSTVVENGEIASGLMTRAIGLLGRAGLDEGQGLLLRPCQSVHTFFMRFPIDVVFLDRENRIIHTVPNMRPNRMSPHMFQAKAILELPSGTLDATMTQIGDKLGFTPS
jgi:uncharacterized membrane protein (UPF0127 family)